MNTQFYQDVLERNEPPESWQFSYPSIMFAKLPRVPENDKPNTNHFNDILNLMTQINISNNFKISNFIKRGLENQTKLLLNAMRKQYREDFASLNEIFDYLVSNNKYYVFKNPRNKKIAERLSLSNEISNPENMRLILGKLREVYIIDKSYSPAERMSEMHRHSYNLAYRAETPGGTAGVANYDSGASTLTAPLKVQSKKIELKKSNLTQGDAGQVRRIEADVDSVVKKVMSRVDQELKYHKMRKGV